MNLDGRDRMVEAFQGQRRQFSRVDQVSHHAIGALIDHDLARFSFVAKARGEIAFCRLAVKALENLARAIRGSWHGNSTASEAATAALKKRPFKRTPNELTL